MDINGIVVPYCYGDSFFGDKYRILFPKYFSVMHSDDASAYSVNNLNVVGCGCKTFISIKVNTVAVQGFVFVFHFGILYEIASVSTGIVIPTFAINRTGFAYDG